MEIKPMPTARRFGTSCVFVALLAFARVGLGMDFSVTHANPFNIRGGEGTNPYLLMRGEIRPGDYNRLIEFAMSNKVDLLAVTFVLDSPGGDVREALALGRFIKGIYAPVRVGPRYGRCASACFIIFASAVDRQSAEGFIGVHRPYVAPSRLRGLPLVQAEGEESQALLDAENYLHGLRVPHSIIDEMFAKASTDIHWLTDAELDELGLRAPWYEEVLIARCGLNPQEESAAFDKGDEPAIAKLGPIYVCANNLTYADAKGNLEAAFRRYAAQNNAH